MRRAIWQPGPQSLSLGNVLRRAVHRWRGFRGNLDHVSEGLITGWVALPEAGGEPCRLGLFAQGCRIAEVLAAGYRADLLRAGISSGQHGFEIRLDWVAQQAIKAAGGAFELRLLGRAGLGNWTPGALIARHPRASGRGDLPAALVADPNCKLAALLDAAVIRLSELTGSPKAEAALPPLWRSLLLAPGQAPKLATRPRLAGADSRSEYQLGGSRESLSKGLSQRPSELPDDGLPNDEPPSTAYLEHMRHRGALDIEAPGTEPDSPATQRYLYRYILGQSLRNGGQRVPLSAGQIAWLNRSEPAQPSGEPPALTRAMRLFLPLAPALAQAPDAQSAAWRARVLIWWLLEGARDLRLEDCLLPAPICLWAASGPEGGRALAALCRGLPELAGLPPAEALPAVLLLAIERPELLLMLPQDALRCFEPGKDGTASAVDALLEGLAATRPSSQKNPGGPQALHQPAAQSLAAEPLKAVDDRQGFGQRQGSGQPPALEPSRAAGASQPLEQGYSAPRTFGQPEILDLPSYAKVLLQRGFDLHARRFLSLTPEGDRLEPMLLPRPKADPGDIPVEVQLIGPLGKASGLGQAARLSALALAQSSLRLNHVSFGVDNPTPEDPSRAGGSALRPARINLIHLNAEAIPSAFAHLPDVFSGAWNIGYVFWELDRPAPCHQLAFELLDEIWVSSAFGVQVFAPYAGIPVTNVGMCFEPLRLEGGGSGPGTPAQLRAEGRAFLAKRAGLAADTFTFLISFDSFSFVQRKNPLGAVTAFRAAFPPDHPGSEGVRLVLKTHNRARAGDPEQAAIWAALDRLLAEDPRLTLIDETLDYTAHLALLAAADGYVSLHRAEGWGFGMIEAMALGVPVLCTAYSGNMEFCSAETAFLVPYHLAPLRPEDYIFVQPGHSWAEPDLTVAAQQMQLMRAKPQLCQQLARRAQEIVQKNFSPNAISQRYTHRLKEILTALDTTRFDPPASGVCDIGPSGQTG